MRLFVAITPPDDVVEDLDDFLDVRRATTTKSGDRLRWSSPEQFHLTLAFAADASEANLDRLTDALASAAGRHTALSASVGGGGAFPDPARAKVLWAGMTTNNEAGLQGIALAARTAMATSGIEVDGGRFRPHVTLARLGQPTNVTAWIGLLDSYRSPAWTVDSISLVQSHLDGGRRRRHHTLAEFELARPSSH